MLNRIVTLEVDSLKIFGQFYLPDSKVSFPTICICHGIPADRRDPGNTGYPQLARKICHQGFAVFIFNFRGTGDSDGNFDILGWTLDLKAVIDYLYTLSEVDKSRLTLLGFSAGAAVSIYAASQDERVSSIVSCACPAEFTFTDRFDTPKAIIDHFRHIGIIRDKNYPSYVDEWLANFRKVKPIKYVSGLSPRPLLLVHGNDDEVVGVSHAHKLYAKAGEPKQLIIIDGAGHRSRQNEKAMAVAIDWLKYQAHICSSKR